MNSSNQFVPPQPMPNQPIASPNGPVAAPDVPVDLPGDAGPLVSTELPASPANRSVATPELAAATPQRRIVVTPATDIIGSTQSLMGTVVIAIFVITFIVQAFQIPSESMENTLLVGDYLLVNKLCYGGPGFGDHVMPYQKIARGDIIVFHYPVDPQQHFVKRVIGVPGDHLRMVDKKVLINGKPLDEPYVRFLEPRNNLFRDDFPRMDIAAQRLEGDWWLEMRKLVVDGQLIIPEGHYFVMGDNRDNSDDSREAVGYVPAENLEGKALFRFFSTDGSARFWEVWKWPFAIRYSRILTLVK